MKSTSDHNAHGKAVVAAVVKRNESFLVCRRPMHKRHGGLWEFPGGKIEEGESILEAAQRELSEELSMNATASGAVLFSVVDEASGYEIKFVDIIAVGDPQLNEHMELSWLPVSDLCKLNLAPSDRLFVENYIAMANEKNAGGLSDGIVG